MRLIVAFFRLIRSLNLLFIALTQFLFQYCIIVPSLRDASSAPQLNNFYFLLLVFASLCIAAAGYIINDYFDLNIDRINKPEKLVVEKIIKRRWAILWHILLSGIGVLISFFVGWKNNHNLLLGFANIGCVLLLWVYSTTFKKKLLTGNIIISLLTGWVVLVLYVAEMPRYFLAANDPIVVSAVAKIFKLAILYSGFAFIISLIREVIKDIEDRSGDEKYGCRTMPIVWGLNASKVFIATWLIVLIAAVLILQVYVMQYRWWWSIVYAVVLILLPLLLIFRRLFSATTTRDFHLLSIWIKLVMMTGILSMIFFCIYD
ncbi:MAG: geranylgeranylglycerol-phosphate geranylgeranyltransferase [Chitinophagaceae bacterium]|nr:geranylgeranylglycerol-phosphate geranylgeranyltransferase [Chitinophagaceae bacterium]